MFDMDLNQPPVSVTTTMGALDTSISVSSAGGFFDNELILVTDNTNTTADLYQISGTPTGSPITLNSGNYNVHPNFPSGGYLASPPAMVAKARFVRYFIDNTTDPAHPTLMVQRLGGNASQPLADDIEDMQFEYGIDTSTPTDGVVDSWIRARRCAAGSGTPGTAAIHRAVAPSGARLVRDAAGAGEPQ